MTCHALRFTYFLILFKKDMPKVHILLHFSPVNLLCHRLHYLYFYFDIFCKESVFNKLIQKSKCSK